MAKNPSTVWYFNDWDNDKTLLACSMAAQGLWMRMLGIAAAATPYGHVKIGDKPCSICDLARLTGQDKRSVSKWVRELDRRGVFSRSEDGTIFCRRMVREAEARAEARARKRAKGVPDKRKSTPSGRHPHRDDNQADLLDDFEKTHTRTRDSDSDSYAVSQDSTTPVEPLPLPVAAPAREGESENNEKGNPKGGRCAPLAAAGAGQQPDKPAIRRTPVGMGRPAFRECNDDAPSSLASATDCRDFALKCKCRSGGPAGTCDRSFDGQASEVPVHHYPILASTGQGRDNALNGEGQPATVGLPRRGGRPPGKSPALKAKIRAQLQQKHARYLQARRRPEELAAYWAAMLDDDPAVVQRAFDDTDRRMRGAGWDDMRAWKLQQGIAA